MRLKRILLITATLALLLALGGLARGGVYLSDILRKDALTPDHEPDPFDLEVAAIGDGSLSLRTTPLASKTGAWTKPGIWGVKGESTYGQVSTILNIGDGQVVRQFRPIATQPVAGEKVRLDGFAFPGDPKQAFGMEFQAVTYTSPIGDFPAWFVDGSRDTWVIFVHGRNSNPREALRMLTVVSGMGFPSLVINYRNDEGLPQDTDGFHRYGLTEWQDLEGAVQYALDHGAKRVVPVGYSMGGAVVMNFLYRSPLANLVQAVIMDSPMVDFNATVDLGVKQRGYPVLVAAIAKGFAQVRFGVDWGALDYLKHTDRLIAPILLFHGDADDTVPVDTSDALASTRPDIVNYVRVANATHVRSWNMDPGKYEDEVRTFLEGLP